MDVLLPCTHSFEERQKVSPGVWGLKVNSKHNKKNLKNIIKKIFHEKLIDIKFSMNIYDLFYDFEKIDL